MTADTTVVSAAETDVVLVDPDSESRATAVAGLGEVGFASIQALPDATALRARLSTGAPAGLTVLNLRLGDEIRELLAELRAAGWHRVLIATAAPNAVEVAAALTGGATGAILGRRSTAPMGPVPTGVHELSDRELEVIRMVADGRSNKWIGTALQLSALTVKSHLARIGRKLGSGDRAHIVAQAMRAGVID